MIRNDREYRHAKEQLGNLQANLDELLDFQRSSERRSEEAPAVMDAVGMQMEDIRREISEYEDLKEGRMLSFETGSLDSLGELLTKARIARGLTQEQLAAELEMTQQQIARYERDGYQKISLWRLAEIAETLQVDLNVRARLPTRTALSK
ncbi:MAG: helix-turn-helix domain-containing protein [Rubrobacteraceae bacterium]